MAKYEVDIPHALPVDEVRSRLERAKAKLERDYGATCTWDQGGVLLVQRKGLDARVHVEAARVRVHLELGLVMSALSGTIRAGITRQLTELLRA
jgi:putative polyhydroxyalkanoate system protein